MKTYINSSFFQKGRIKESFYSKDRFVEKMKLWDISTGKCIRTLGTHPVCISPDGRLALSVDNESKERYKVELWDFKTGKCIETFTGFTESIKKVSFSPNGYQIVAASASEIRIYSLDFDLHFPGWHDWDEGARPYLEIFLTLHPNWTDDDFNNILIPDLQNRGYGWLKPEGVRKELEKMTHQRS